MRVLGEQTSMRNDLALCYYEVGEPWCQLPVVESGVYKLRSAYCLPGLRLCSLLPSNTLRRPPMDLCRYLLVKALQTGERPST